MSQFQNANAYERYMSGWSRAAGTQFLDWLALPPGLRWLDVGCGSGAFTALLAERAAPPVASEPAACAAHIHANPTSASSPVSHRRPALAEPIPPRFIPHFPSNQFRNNALRSRLLGIG